MYLKVVSNRYETWQKMSGLLVREKLQQPVNFYEYVRILDMKLI
jgi:hypothetical protein